MLIATTATGEFIVGVEEANLRLLQEGKPMALDLRQFGGKDQIVLFYGADMQALMKQIERLSDGPLPPAQNLPPAACDQDHRDPDPATPLQ